MKKANHKKPKKPASSFTIRCGPEYRAWLQRLLTKQGSSERVTEFVARLILEFARKRGVEDPPDRQT